VSSVCNASEQRRKYREYLDCTAVVGGVSLNEAIRALAGNLAGFRGRSVKYRDAMPGAFTILPNQRYASRSPYTEIRC
jgi:hypothetical protein